MYVCTGIHFVFYIYVCNKCLYHYCSYSMCDLCVEIGTMVCPFCVVVYLVCILKDCGALCSAELFSYVPAGRSGGVDHKPHD